MAGIAGTRTGRDHEPLGMEPGLTVDHDRVIGLEHGRAVKDRDSTTDQRFVRLTAREIGDDGADPGHHGGEIDRGCPGVDTVALGSPCLVGQPRRRDECRLRNNGRVRACTAGRCIPHECDPGAVAGRRQRHFQALRPIPQHHEIVHRPVTPPGRRW